MDSNVYKQIEELKDTHKMNDGVYLVLMNALHKDYKENQKQKDSDMDMQSLRERLTSTNTEIQSLKNILIEVERVRELEIERDQQRDDVKRMNKYARHFARQEIKLSLLPQIEISVERTQLLKAIIVKKKNSLYKSILSLIEHGHEPPVDENFNFDGTTHILCSCSTRNPFNWKTYDKHRLSERHKCAIEKLNGAEPCIRYIKSN